MLIATHNVNGIRAAHKRGYAHWLDNRHPDLIALQEVRCRVEQLPERPFGLYEGYYDAGTLAGRNGVAILTSLEVEAVRTWGGSVQHIAAGGMIASVDEDRCYDLVDGVEEFAHEGRYIEVDLADLPLTVASVYIPKGDSPYALRPGTDSHKAQMSLERKMRFLDAFARHCDRAASAALDRGRHFLVMGDYNIAHQEVDLKNHKSNHKSSGFLPEERAWMSDFLASSPLEDVVRLVHPDSPGPYSWWSWRGQAFTNDAGWRIDYHMATSDLAARARCAYSDREDAYDQRLSDHCPVCVDYEME